MKLHKAKALRSLFYATGQITLGFLLHPYQTMQAVVADKVFAPLFVLPIVLLFSVIVAWKNLVVPLVRVFFSCAGSGVVICDWLPYISKVVIVYCWLWQVLLLYLFLRFYFFYLKK